MGGTGPRKDKSDRNPTRYRIKLAASTSFSAAKKEGSRSSKASEDSKTNSEGRLDEKRRKGDSEWSGGG